MKVFKNKFGNWETLFQNHMLNGETVKYYMPVSFQKGREPLSESIDIEPISWWGSCFLTKEGQTKPKLFIADWKELEVKTARKQQKTAEDASIEEFKAQNYAEYKNGGKTYENSDIDLSSEALPFY